MACPKRTSKQLSSHPKSEIFPLQYIYVQKNEVNYNNFEMVNA